MPKLKTLTVHKFQDVKPTTLRFHPLRNVLLGKNGGGKTTLLKLISMILRSAFHEVAEREFDIEFEYEVDDTESVRVRLTNRARAIAVGTPDEVLITAAKERFEPSGKLELFRNGALVATVESSDREAKVTPPERWRWSVELPPNRPLHWALLTAFVSPRVEFSRRPVRFDEALGLYADIFSGDQTLMVAGSGPLNPSATRGGKWLPDALVGEVFLKWKAAPDALVWPDTDPALPFLRRARTEMGFSAAEYVLRARNQRSVPGGMEVTFESLQARFHWSENDYISDADLSYGQKRFLAFLHYLACNPDFVVADELVNGLHHDWIRVAVGEIGARQAFLTSQNPLLFDYLDLNLAKDVRDQFVLCAAVPAAGRRPTMDWTQMSDAKAHELEGAFARGIQYASEILQSEGLW